MAKPPPRRRIAEMVTADGVRLDVTAPRGQVRNYGRRWVLLFDDTAMRLAQQIRSATAFRVWLALPARLSWDSWRRLPQAELATQLGVDQAAISRALVELVAVRIVERRGGRGPIVEWRLHPDGCWRGSVDAYHAMQAERQRVEQVSSGALPAAPKQASLRLLRDLQAVPKTTIVKDRQKNKKKLDLN